jgi:NAD-dependent deacetylase
VHHMHGSLFQSRCTHCNVPFPDTELYDAAALPSCTRCGAPIRPHIVWFGEIPLDMEGVYRELHHAAILLVVGTSGSVYPAAGLVDVANQRRIHSVYVGPEEPLNAGAFDEILLGSAVQVLPSLVD